MVLTPDGARFSMSDSRRDWEEELLYPIREVYARYTSGRTDAHYLDQWSGDPRRLLENDGRIDLNPYFTALLVHRDTLRAEPSKATEIARANGLNPKYFGLMVQSLGNDQSHSALLNDWRKQWARLKPQDAARWVQQVNAWQKVLCKFQSVSHLGLIQPWQAPVSPTETQLHFSQPIPAESGGNERQIEITIGCAGEESDGDQVVLVRPRIEYADRPAILLRDLPQMNASLRRLQAQELGRLDEYLLAVAKWLHEDGSKEKADNEPLHPQILNRLSKLLDLTSDKRPALTGHFKSPHAQVAGQAAIQGWSTNELPVILANRSDRDVSFSTLTVPAKSVTLHPTPDKSAAVAWQCPQTGEFNAELTVTDQDGQCGNGIHWSLQQLISRGHTVELASGDIDSGSRLSWASESPLKLTDGEVIQLVISARDRDHVCDTTGVQLVFSSTADERKWNLALDVANDLLAGNPHADTYGHREVWHFLTPDQLPETSAVPANSTLARWRQAAMESGHSSEVVSLARDIREQVVAPEAAALSAADTEVRRLLSSGYGPIGWIELANAATDTSADDVTSSNLFGLPFGTRDTAQAVDSASLQVTAPQRLVCSLPADLTVGGQLVFDVTLVDPQSAQGSVQVQLNVNKPSTSPSTDVVPVELMAGVPILIGDHEQASAGWDQAFAEFRSLFPAAMCHTQIVPIDAVVTLVLFHREDEPLCRLMLSDEEAVRLNHLWQELHFVSEDALRMETSLEQILEFSTQDADPKFFDPVRRPIAENAERFRAAKLAAQPRHLEWLLGFAADAFRRPLSTAEIERLQTLYQSLRLQAIEHDAAVRLLIARVLSSPSFLYRLEAPLDQAEPSVLPPYQLATRLSYFLWSSTPDKPLLRLAESGDLLKPEILQAQVSRMLRDPKHRRLAIEFMCQWMHLRDLIDMTRRVSGHFRNLVRCAARCTKRRFSFLCI